MPYRIGSNTIITEGDASPASANASFRNFFYRYSLNPATFVGTVGTNYGYITGGTGNQPLGTVGGYSPNIWYAFPLYNGSPSIFNNNVERFPFASSINTVQVSGSLSTARAAFASQSSKTAGYSSGGYLPIPVPLTPTTPANGVFQNITASNVIDSFPFVAMGIITVSSAGSLSAARMGCSGQQSDTAGFTSAGSTSNTVQVATIDNFPFSSFTTATSVGNLSANNSAMAGHSSATSGYTSGGYSPINLTTVGGQSPYGTALTTINRYPFSVSPVTATSVASLATARGYISGGSSPTFGYTFSGFGTNPGSAYNNPGWTNASIERFSFSEQTVTVSAVPASLTTSRLGYAVISSPDNIYVCGGYGYTSQYWYYGFPNPGVPYPAAAINTIDRFPFASTTVAATTTNLTTAKGHLGGNQY